MKKLRLIILFCLMSIPVCLVAQQNADKKKKEDFEKFKEQRKVALSQAMELTESESAAFWPICDEFQAKKFELNKPLRAELRKVRQAKKEGKTVSDADYKKIVELSIAVKIKEAQLEEEYIAKFLEIIPAGKIFRYQQAEQQFARTMFEQRGKNRK